MVGRTPTSGSVALSTLKTPIVGQLRDHKPPNQCRPQITGELNTKGRRTKAMQRDADTVSIDRGLGKLVLSSNVLRCLKGRP